MPVRELVPLLGLGDPLSAMTHWLVGLFLFVQVGFLLQRSGDRGERRQCLLLYVLFVGGMFLASGTYHGLPSDHALKGLFWRLDHAGVWLAIAASITPVQILRCTRATRKRRLTAVWGIALVGVVAELSVIASLPLWVSPLLYVGMGWVCFPAIWEVWQLRGFGHVGGLLFGGTLATFGGFVDALEAPNLWPGVFEAHELLHVCIVTGWFFYYRSHWQAADGHLQPPEPSVVTPALEATAA